MHDIALEQHLQHLEECLLQPETRKSVKDITALLANEFVEFSSSGKIFDKHQTIEGLLQEIATRWSVLDFKVVPLAKDVALTTYRAVRYREVGEQPVYSLRSSIWKLMGDRWQMVFHQGTLC